MQVGYEQCGCCGRMYRDDGSEDQLYKADHGMDYHPEDAPQEDPFAQYCDYCEQDGHTFRSCPRRDDV